MTAVGQRLDQAQVSYEQARKRLSDGPWNLIRRAERVRELGAKAVKSWHMIYWMTTHRATR